MRTRLIILFLAVTGVAAGDKKTDLKPTFRYEGQTYTIDSINAHINGSMANVEFFRSQDGWHVIGVRESKDPITNNLSTFVPHIFE